MVEPDPSPRDAERPRPEGPLPSSAAELLPIVYGELRRLARDRMARERRGGDYRSFPLDQLDLAVETRPAEVLAVDAAFEKLTGSDPRAADVVRMRFYAGLGEEEAAAVLGLSVRTVRREWAYARTRLFEALRDEG